jgi:hypothetical protein
MDVKLPAKATAISKPLGGMSQTLALMLWGSNPPSSTPISKAQKPAGDPKTGDIGTPYPGKI